MMHCGIARGIVKKLITYVNTELYNYYQLFNGVVLCFHESVSVSMSQTIPQCNILKHMLITSISYIVACLKSQIFKIDINIMIFEANIDMMYQTTTTDPTERRTRGVRV